MLVNGRLGQASSQRTHSPIACLPKSVSRRTRLATRSALTATCTSAQKRRQKETLRDTPTLPVYYRHEQEPLHMYVALQPDALSPQNTLGFEQALKVGLKALRLLGITGVSVDVLWGVVEKAGPQQYNWSGYKVLFDLIVGLGFKLKVNLCFNSCEAASLPDWLLEVGHGQPDIWYTDKSGQRSQECLSLGVNHVPCLRGRTALQVYTDCMKSFREEFSGLLLGGQITDLVIGLGPKAELRYPSNPASLWEYPGVGEFQCYDRYMLASLKACAQQVQQPPWGLGGPHDAGPYKSWPHQSGFFLQNGNWCSPYGRFFLQWYAEMLIQHASSVMGAATRVFAGCPVLLNARIPGYYWWYNTSARAAELTAGYHSTLGRDGYLPVFSALCATGAGVHLSMAEQKTSDKLPNHCADPERLLAGQRTVAAALRMPVTVENSEPRFDDAALARVTSVLFDRCSHQGVELPRPRSLVFNRMSDVMFEPSNWQRFKGFVHKVRKQTEESMAVLPTSSMSG